jgi:hypothetical protein
MLFLKRYAWWIPIILLVTSGVVYVGSNPCRTPIAYKIGTFDTQFGMSEKEFLSKVDEAGTLWEEVAHKDLFVYDPDADFEINLIFDDRQATTFKNQTLQSHAEEAKGSAAEFQQEFEALQTLQKKESREYEVAVALYEKEQQAYNQKVDYWNDRGGAPQAEFNKLTKESASLATKASSLEKQRIALNNRATAINALIDKYNSLIEVANQKIQTINQSAGKEFNEGEYISDKIGERINIYEYTSETELVRVLSHELGHAIGLEHNNNPDSIMYYLNESTNKSPTPEDRGALKKLCRIK